MTGQGDDYTNVRLLNYPYFKEYYKLIAIGLGKQQKLNADPKAIQKIDLTGNPERLNNVFHYLRSERNSFRLFKANS